MSLSTALISVDLVVFQSTDGNGLQVLGHTNSDAPDTVAPQLPAGRIDIELDEHLDDTVKRQLHRFISTPPSYFEQVVTIGDNQRDSRGWSMSVVYYVLVPPCPDVELSEDARWINIQKDTPTTPFAYDHNQLIKEALERLKTKIQYSVLPVYLLPETFTLSDIQKVFSVILDKAPPMRSIRNRFLSNDILQETDRKRRGSCRPAALYRLNADSQTLLFNRLYLSTQHTAGKT